MSKTIPARFRYVTTRKVHTCEGCGKNILPGSKALAVRGRIMGQFFSEHWCNECDLDRINSIPDGKLRAQLLTDRKLGTGWRGS